MNTHEKRCVARLFESLSTLTDPENTLEEFALAVMELNQSSVGHLCRVPETMATGRFVERWYGDFEPELLKAHETHVWHHPIWPYIKKVEEASYSQVDVVGRTTFFNTGYGRDFSNKLGIYDQHALNLKGSDGVLLWGIGLLHYKRPKRAALKGLKLLGSLSKHLGRGLENIEGWHRQIGSLSTLLAAIYELPEPYALVEGKRLLFASKLMAATLKLNHSPASRNIWLRDFIRACSHLKSAATIVPYDGVDGRRYLLSGVRTSADLSKVWLIRLSPTDGPDLNDDAANAIKAGLSKREADVLALMAKGLASKQIARELNIAYNTVRTLANRIFQKLGVSGRIEAINAVRSIGMQSEAAGAD